MTGRRDIRNYRSERGFTLFETLLVVALTTMIGVGIVAALFEGMDTLQTVTDTQNVEFAQQRIMTAYMDDIKNATWFYNGTTHDEAGNVIPGTYPNASELILGYEGPEGNEVWIRYKSKPGIFEDTRPEIETETYLRRTVINEGPPGDGSSYLAVGIANLAFEYYDADGLFASDLTEVKRIVMTVSITSGGSVLERSYEGVLRNENLGVRTPPGDFNEIESDFAVK